MEKWYWVDTGYGCGGIAVKNGSIVYTCPIFRWMVGKSVEFIKSKYNVKELKDRKNNSNKREAS